MQTCLLCPGRREGEGSDKGVCSVPSWSGFALGSSLGPREVALSSFRCGRERLSPAKKLHLDSGLEVALWEGSGAEQSPGVIWVQVEEKQKPDLA